MIVLRAALFNLAFYCWTAILGLILLPILFAPRKVAARIGYWWSASVLLLARLIIGLKYELRGAEHIPPGAAIVAMKHQSAWDTLAAPVLIVDPAIVIKRELLLIPCYGWYAAKAGMIAVDRGAGVTALKHMIERARVVAECQRKIVIFPEGTRTEIGARRPYQPGVAALYTQLGLPVVPVALNSGLFWRRRSFVKKPGRIVVEFLPPIPPGMDRKKFLAELQNRIEAATARLVAEAGAGAAHGGGV